jgi:glucose/arabinose dehydrogenase
VGYKIVKLEVAEDKVLRSEDFITGWLKENGDVLGRPVDLVFGADGVLYISDDKAGLIYILTK